MDKPKYKSDIVISEFDQTWYGRFYRWMNWDMTEDMIVNASPEVCIAHIQPDQARNAYNIVALDGSRPSYYYTVKPQIEHYPYWFTLELSHDSSRSSYIGHVFANIAPYENDGQRTLITFRTYPYGFFFTISVVSGVVVMAVALLESPSAPSAPQAYNGAFILSLLLGFLVFAIASWRLLFVARRKALNIVTDHFVSLSRYGLNTDERHKGSRSHLEWPVILPFDDEIAVESTSHEQQTQKQ